ncbi:MAG: tRNA (guanosine(37)-N1)-methyltransferase TrmD [Patescibacteria group bacterium]|nr:tRNA (guanosine(37)-N1)-methyltransferase TrmD [Patescibacteria group bacterium]
MIHFHIITLFPESIEPYIMSSIIGRAIATKKIKVTFYDPKDFALDRYGRVDRRPYGGGPGMVLEPDAILRAAQKAIGRKKGVEKIFFATDGAQFDEKEAKRLAKPARRGGKKHILFICGHYEGVDARVQKILKAKKVSMGPYVLTGGELPAATVIDAVSRFVPDVLGKAESLEESRVSSPEVYTRPEVLEWKGKKYRVPKVLLTGHHAKIEEWKRKIRQR